MSYISGARLVADEQVRIASTKIDGIGPKKAIQVRYRLGISGNIKIKELTKYQIDQIEQMIGQDHVVHWELKRGERADIERLISISCYRGIRHQDGLPLRSQLTQVRFRRRVFFLFLGVFHFLTYIPFFIRIVVELKKIIAYSSVAHMNLVTIGMFERVSLLIASFFWDWTFTWVGALVVFLEELFDFVLSAMEGFPLSVGGGRPSNSRPFDLNFPPSPSPEPGPEPAPPAPLAEETLRAKRNKVKGWLCSLLQLGWKKSRPSSETEELISSMNIENETDLVLLDKLERMCSHLYENSFLEGGRPKMFSYKKQEDLRNWFFNLKTRGPGEGTGEA